MDLTTCRQCGMDVAASATTCPNCGIADPGGHRRISPAVLAILGIVGVLFAVIMFADLGPSNQPAATADSPKLDSAAERRRAAAEQKSLETWRLSSIASDTKASCRASAERAHRIVRAHEDWSDQDLIRVICKEIWEGITADQLLAAWGRPQGITRNSTGYQQWEYGSGTYVFLAGTYVTSWQTYSH